MSSASSSSQNENEYSHRQGSVQSIPDEEDQATVASDPSMTQKRRSSSNGLPKVPNLDDGESVSIDREYQIASIDFQTVPDINNEDNTNQNWEQLSKETTSINDQRYQTTTQSDSADDLTTSFGFQQQDRTTEQEINPTIDYETIIRSQKLYFDPDPEFIRKPQMIKPLIYKQNVTIKFLKPPPVPLGPLIIREVRPPQPPPPPPLIIRQRPPPPLSPPPLVLREKPPRAPAIVTTQVLTKQLPPIPPPPRSVVIEKLPPLPPKPRDIIIERWIPYESTTYKRKVVVQPAEKVKPYPPPRNLIITYDNVEAKIIRQFQRSAIIPEDPESYTARYGDSLLDTKELLAKVQELGITEDISLPNIIDHELKEQQLTSNPSEQYFPYENSFQQNNFEKRSSKGNYTSDIYNGINNNMYAPTYENLINGSSLLINHDELNGHLIGPGQENNGDDLSIQLAKYGLTKQSIPF